MGTIVRQVTVAEMLADPALPALIDEYAAECSATGMPAPDPQFGVYEAMEKAGLLCVLGAWRADVLVGLLVLIVSTVPHYAQPLATSESYFVTKAARKGGTGLLLLREAERVAAAVGAKALYISAPTGGRLERVLCRVGYRNTNRVFCRELG